MSTRLLEAAPHPREPPRAEEHSRFPDDGPAFYIGLSLGDSELGLSSDAGVEPLGGHAQGPANDMPRGQRVAHIADPDGNVANLTQTL